MPCVIIAETALPSSLASLAVKGSCITSKVATNARLRMPQLCVKQQMRSCRKSFSDYFSAMSWCSEWIRDWLRAGDRSQSDLASLGGVDPGNVSRWISGQSKPDKEAVAKLIQCVGPSEGSHLLVAWLKDTLPPGAENLVRIAAVPSPGVSGEYESNCNDDDVPHRFKGRVLPSGIGGELAERLIFFGELAVLNPDVRKIIDVCYEAAQRAQASRAT